jgi:oligopeptide/dipeptide ABC transporter ATP-binding protein
MRQRVMIAIALACNPKLLIADDRDGTGRHHCGRRADLFHELRTEHEMGVIIITHDMERHRRRTRSSSCTGQIVSGNGADLFDNPSIRIPRRCSPRCRRSKARVPDGRLLSIPGRPPDLIEPPPACRFAPRCTYAGQDDCAILPPELREIRPGHWVRSAHPASERAAEPVGVA